MTSDTDRATSDPSIRPCAGRARTRPRGLDERTFPGGEVGAPGVEDGRLETRPDDDRDTTTWTWHDTSWTRPGSLLHHEVWTTDVRLGHVAAVVDEPGRARLEVDSPSRSRRVVIPAGLVSVVDHQARMVTVNVSSRIVDEAPEVPPAGLRQLGRHYGRYARRVVT